MICEYCKLEHNENYASGRFCSKKCSCGFSTSKNREAINEKVSLKLSKQIHICFICGENASRKSGGTEKYCIQHKHREGKDLTFKERKTSKSRKKFLLIKFRSSMSNMFRRGVDGKTYSNST